MDKLITMISLLFAALMLMTSSALAFEIDIPVECTLGEDCFIRNYVDQAKKGEWQDYKCRKLSYDKHKGTDFGVPVLHPQKEGVQVLAAADGIVRAFRNDEPDGVFFEHGIEAVKGKECGNGLVLLHEQGWETQYCHLKRGSIRIQKGQKVTRGQVLGEIGLSGKTEFPHLHLSIRDKNKNPIDPFNSKPMETGCAAAPKASLWSAKAKAEMNVEGTGLLVSGVSTGAVKKQNIMQGQHTGNVLPKNADALIFWTMLFGPQAGDKLVLELMDANATILAEHTHQFSSFKAQFLQYIGKKRSKMPQWPVGSYQGRVKIMRGSQIIDSETFQFEVK